MLFAAADAARAGAAVRLTLDEAIARGLEASHRLAEIGAREDAARAVEDQRQAASMPQLAPLAGYTRTNHVDEFGIPGGGRVIYPGRPGQLPLARRSAVADLHRRAARRR